MTCGDNGGVNEDGSPCTRKAGWGVRPKTDDGMCKVHIEKPDYDAGLKAEFLAEYREGKTTIRSACGKAGMSEAKLWKLRQVDEAFDKEVRELTKLSDVLRAQAIEDALFMRVLAGKATGTETIFWLTNRAPDRWKHMNHLRLGSDPDAPPYVFVSPTELTPEEWLKRYGPNADE